MEIYESGRTGLMAGLLSGLMIIVPFVAMGSQLRMDPFEFYTMIGIAVGLHGQNATIFGLAAHMLTAMTIGAVFCICSTLHPLLRLTSTPKGLLAGAITGLVVYAAFFMPITVHLVLPAINSLNGINFADMTTEERIITHVVEPQIPLIMAGAVVFHVLYGSIMGIYSSFFLPDKYRTLDRRDLSSSLPENPGGTAN